MRGQRALPMPSLGDEFRSAREARGLSLSDVAERLHIRSVYLAAIEDEDWTAIGAPVYVRGFMRTYARFLGLDAEAAVARFTALVPPAGTAAPAEKPRTATSAAGGDGSRSGMSVGAMLAIVVALAAVAFVGYEFYQYRGGAPAGPVAVASPAISSSPMPRSDATDAPAGADASAAPADEDSAAPSDAASGSPAAGASGAPASPATTAPASGKRELGLRITATSWVRVTVDGKVAYEGTLPAGTAKVFTGSNADVRVGNAGGVDIAVNGRPLGPLGASGDVVERHFVLGE
jgi:cytoskeleton protein RodZ